MFPPPLVPSPGLPGRSHTCWVVCFFPLVFLRLHPSVRLFFPFIFLRHLLVSLPELHDFFFVSFSSPPPMAVGAEGFFFPLLPGVPLPPPCLFFSPFSGHPGALEVLGGPFLHFFLLRVSFLSVFSLGKLLRRLSSFELTDILHLFYPSSVVVFFLPPHFSFESPEVRLFFSS